MLDFCLFRNRLCDRCIDSEICYWSDEIMKDSLPVEKFSVSLPLESLTQLEAIAMSLKLPPRTSRSMKIRVAIQHAYEQVLFEKNLLE